MTLRPEVCVFRRFIRERMLYFRSVRYDPIFAFVRGVLLLVFGNAAARLLRVMYMKCTCTGFKVGTRSLRGAPAPRRRARPVLWRFACPLAAAGPSRHPPLVYRVRSYLQGELRWRGGSIASRSSASSRDARRDRHSETPDGSRDFPRHPPRDMWQSSTYRI